MMNNSFVVIHVRLFVLTSMYVSQTQQGSTHKSVFVLISKWNTSNICFKSFIDVQLRTTLTFGYDWLKFGLAQPGYSQICVLVHVTFTRYVMK